MNGVRILHTINNPIYGFGIDWRFIVAFLITGAIIALTIFIAKDNKKNSGSWLDNNSFMLIMFSILGVAISVLFLLNGKIVGTYPTYEICFDEPINMMEFTEKYEVLEQRDDIFVVKEKD